MGGFLWQLCCVGMFYGLLHHLSVELVKHVSVVNAREGAYSVEFAVVSHRRTLSIGFSEGKQFVCMPIVPCGKDVSPTKVYIHLRSRLLSVISGDATMICCGGSSAEFVKVLDESPGRKVGLQNPFTLTPLQFERLLHNPSSSVMGRIDVCSMLRTLLLRLNELWDEHWVQSTQYFRKVRFGNNSLLSPGQHNFGSLFSCFVGPRRWKIRVVNCVSCYAGDDHSLAPDCCIQC